MIAKIALATFLSLSFATLTQAGEPSPAGTWKIALPTRQGVQVLWLVRLSETDGKWTGAVVASAEGLPKSNLEGLTVTKDLASFRLSVKGDKIPFEMRPGAADVMLGSARLGGRVQPLKFERTKLKELDPFELEKEQLDKGAVDQDTVRLALALLGQAREKKAKLLEVRRFAEKAIKTADAFGPAFRRDVLLDVVTVLNMLEGYAAVALQYARQAERLIDPAKDRVAIQKRSLDLLAAALKNAGKEDEAKEVAARVEKIDISLKPTPYPGRKAKSDRAVLVELFTGAQCPPCVAADLGFDALSKAFKPSEVVCLEYHLHVPGPDPLTNPDTEARAKFYDRSVEGTPTMMFNGKAAAGGGGGMDAGADKYEEYADVIRPLLEKPERAKIHLTATRKDGKIEINAEVSDLEQTGDDVRLRLALVEETVDYKAPNGLGAHHHVVRSFPGGADGTPLKQKTAKKSVTVDLAELRKGLSAYLDKYAEKDAFPTKERPLELKKFKVVAFVQNDENVEVLQAVQADVKGE
jgi:hypothetical protein